MDNKNNNRKGPGGNRQGWGIIMFTTLLAVFVVMGLYSLMQDKKSRKRSAMINLSRWSIKAR